MKKIILLLLTILIVFFFIACEQTNVLLKNTLEQENEISLIISVAASLKDAMEEIKTEYAKENSNVTIILNFGSSGSLQHQIEQGAQVDLFISAASKQMDALKDNRLIIESTRIDLLENEIVLIVPKDSSQITNFEDLKSNEVYKVGLGEPKSVPAGYYAKEVLTKLNIHNLINDKFVYGKDVKEVLTWVETENVDAGIVYETDAKASDNVEIVAKALEGLHKPIYYPVAVIKESKNIEMAKDFISYLCNNKSKTIFEKYGFKSIVE